MPSWGKRTVFGLMLALTAPVALANLGASVTTPEGGMYPGEVKNILITLTNSDKAYLATDVGFEHTLAGTLVIKGAATSTCSGVLTADAGSKNIQLIGGKIPKNDGEDGTCSITIPVTATTTDGSQATYRVDIESGKVTGKLGGVDASNSGKVEQTVTIKPIDRPTVSKSFDSNNIYLGGSSTTLTITLENNAPVEMTGVGMVDNLPGNIQVASTPEITVTPSSCGAAGIVNVTETDKVVIAGATLPANGSCEIKVKVEGKSTNAQHSWQQTNSLKVTDFSSDIGITPSSGDSKSITVTSPLAVSKSVGTQTLSDGEENHFIVTLKNNGTSSLVINNFTDSPIDGLSGTPGYGLEAKAVDAANSSCTSGGSLGAFSLTAGERGVTQTLPTTIAAGGSCTIRIKFKATVQTAGTPITYTNTILPENITTATPGVVAQRAEASVLVADDLRVLKAVSPSSGVVPGSAVRYSVTVQNFGASSISNVTITDSFTGGQTFVTGNIDGVDYSPSLSGTGCKGLTVVGANTGEPKFTVGTLPARTSETEPGACTVHFYAKTSNTASGATTNIINAGNVCYPGSPDPKCNGGTSNEVSTNTRTESVTVEKSYNMASPQPEGTVVRATIKINNWSSRPLQAAISDNLPLAVSGGQMRVANPANVEHTCGGANAVASATPGGTAVTLDGAVVPARGSNGTASTPGSCTLSVNLVAGAGRYVAADGKHNEAVVEYTETRMDGSTKTGTASGKADFVFESSLCSATNPCTKTFNPGSVSSGGKSTVRVTLTNSGAMAVHNVKATDKLPAGMVLADPPKAYTTCAGETDLTAVAGAGVIHMTGAEMPGNANCDLIFDVIATGSANWTNTIKAGDIEADGGITNQSDFTGVLNYNPPNNPIVTKATSPSSLTHPGQTSVLTIKIENGSKDLTNVSLNDYFTLDGTEFAEPNGMLIAPSPNASTTCVDGLLVAKPNGTHIALSGVTLAASASCEIKVNVTSNRAGGITNVIPASSLVSDQGLSNTGPAMTSLSTSANLGVVKQFTPNVIKPGETSRLRITINNPTNKTVSNLSVTDSFPNGLAVSGTGNPVTNCSGAAITATGSPVVLKVTGGTLSGNASCYAEIDVTASSEGDYPNIIGAGDLTGTVDGSPVTNPQPTDDTLQVKAPLEVHKAFANASPAENRTLDAGDPAGFKTGEASQKAGSVFTLTVNLKNPNATPLNGVSFTDELPSGLVLAPSGTLVASNTCSGSVAATHSGTQFRLAGGSLAGSASCTVTMNVISNIPGSYTNTLVKGSVTTTEGVTNDNPTNARVVIATPPSVAKEFEPAVIAQNGKSRLTIYLGNDNALPITLTEDFVDTLPTTPGAINVHSTPTVGGTCAPAFIAATAGIGTTVTYKKNAEIPAGGCTISVDVTGDTAGTHTNIIAAGALQTNVGNNTDPANAVLSISTDGYISGKVFTDNKAVPNGVFAPDDTPIPGQIIELYRGNSCVSPSVKVAETSTDAAGNYLFAGLSAYTYTVCQPQQPSGTTNAAPKPGAVTGSGGGTQGIPSNPLTGPSSQIAGITLGESGGVVSGSGGNDFPELPVRTVSGRVFLDYNKNGTQDGAEQGISGVGIQLKDSSENLVATAVTDSQGNYVFDKDLSGNPLPAGTYTIYQPAQPEGTSNGTTVAGTTGGTPSNSGDTSTIASIDLTGSKVTSKGNNFAEEPDAPDLTISKTHSPGSFVAGSNPAGYYTLVPSNVGPRDSSGSITIVDDLPAGMTALSASGSGWSCAVINPQQVSCTGSDVIAANGGKGKPILVHVAVAASASGTLINKAQIAGGGEPDGFDGNNRTEDPTSILTVDPSDPSNVASLAGNVWRDHDGDRVFDPGQGEGGWTVELLYKGVVVKTTETAADGSYKFSSLAPGSGYEVRFRHPETGAIWGNAVPNEQGSPFQDGMVSATNPAGAIAGSGTLKNLTLLPGQNITEQSLPLDPAGVVYDAVTREPVAGAVVTIKGPPGFNPAIHLVGGAGSVTTGSDGMYQFLLNPGAPAGDYRLEVTTYPAGYLPHPSTMIPVCSPDSLDVTAGSNDPERIQQGITAPAGNVPMHNPNACVGGTGPNTTQYYFEFKIGPGSKNIINNHIPLDPILGGAIVMTKTTPKVNVVRGEMVPYVLTATNTLTSTLVNVAVEDQIPPGFKYVKGSSQVEGVPREPTVNGRRLAWNDLTLNPGQKLTFKMLLVVGTGVGYNEYVNQTWAMNQIANSRISNMATATVRVVADPTFECSDLIGTVYDDKNRNGYQDQGEPGLPGVRVATPKGWLVTTDNHGRYHIACADVPNEMRGGNFIVKVDERTLPSGYRVVTENPRVVRLSQGRLVKANFGASIHRVVRLDLTPDAFDGKQLKPGYQEQMSNVLQALHAEPSILRIAYRMPVGEKPKVARQRIKSVTTWVKKNWEPQECCYDLQLEEEIVPAIDSVEVVR